MKIVTKREQRWPYLNQTIQTVYQKVSQRQRRTLYVKRINLLGKYSNYIYAPNIRVPKYKKQKLTELKKETDSSTIIVRDFNMSL